MKATMQSIFSALTRKHGFTDGSALFAWFCTLPKQQRESVAQMTKGETIADVIEDIAFCKKAGENPALKPTELEAVPLFKEEKKPANPAPRAKRPRITPEQRAALKAKIDTKNLNTNPQNQTAMKKTRKQIVKSLATAKAQVTRYSKQLAQYDEQAEARKEARREHAKVLTDADKAPLKFGDYSTKCFVVFGGTKSRLDLFSGLKAKGLCSFNPALRINAAGAKAENAQPQGGWLFYKSKTADMKSLQALCK